MNISVQHIDTNEYKQYDMILKNLLCEVYQEGLFKMEMCYDGALVMPKNYAVVNNEEMEYVDGGWSGRQVLKNVIGMTACFSLGYIGNAFAAFVRANQGLSYGKLLAKCGVAAWNFIKALPWQAKVVVGVALGATIWALGQYDLW